MDSSTTAPPPPPTLRIGFQGTFGAYSESALVDFYHQVHQLVPVDDDTTTGSVRGRLQSVAFTEFSELFDALEAGDIDRGFVPVENTRSGSFPEIHAQLRARAVHVTAEYVVRERHCLVAHPGVTLADLVEIRSHPAVLDQCRGFLDRASAAVAATGENKALLITQAMDTAASAEYVAADPGSHRYVAAIASAEAARRYGLVVLVNAIQVDSPTAQTTTRYFELSAERPTSPPPRHASPKTLLALTLKNTAGTLFKALSCFALRDLNVTKLESRPLGNQLHPWELVFYVTVEAAVNDAAFTRAIVNLEEYVTSIKVLGCFASTQQPNRGDLSRVYGV
ncbi:hypothetical protein BC828DRAFT_381330 [Blastocladiella britannica]|nr:hypothetical protein BC828DRAFT_381330 [Blastocladiella britannica]